MACFLDDIEACIALLWMPVSLERRDLAMTCGDIGHYANANNIVSQCAHFHVNSDEATAIIDAMEDQVKTSWYNIAHHEGVTEADCSMISSTFAFRGGWLDPEKAAQA